MKISEDRFRSILAGTATNLSSKEILIRQAAFDAERLEQDPMLAVEAQMPDVVIVRKGAYTETIPPLDVLLENARLKKAIASGSVPSGKDGREFSTGGVTTRAIPRESATKGTSDDATTGRGDEGLGFDLKQYLTVRAESIRGPFILNHFGREFMIVKQDDEWVLMQNGEKVFFLAHVGIGHTKALCWAIDKLDDLASPMTKYGPWEDTPRHLRLLGVPPLRRRRFLGTPGWEYRD
jgi:hypothetical protein